MSSREEIERERWRRAARSRPDEIVRTGPGQESVWEYPRPPRLERVMLRVRVEFADAILAESDRALRVCETASPPTYYVPPEDVRTEYLEPTGRTTFCEWKGLARYWSVRIGDRFSADAAWSYPEPDAAYPALRDHLAFHAGRVDTCRVGDAVVTPQPGDYYGGWITPEILGPFKGEPGSEGW